MNRSEKIQLIKAIKTGDILPEDIRQKNIYVFYQMPEHNNWKGKYKTDETTYYTNEEYQAIKNEINAASSRREMAGLEADIIINVIREQKRKDSAY